MTASVCRCPCAVTASATARADWTRRGAAGHGGVRSFLVHQSLVVSRGNFDDDVCLDSLHFDTAWGGTLNKLKAARVGCLPENSVSWISFLPLESRCVAKQL